MVDHPVADPHPRPVRVDVLEVHVRDVPAHGAVSAQPGRAAAQEPALRWLGPRSPPTRPASTPRSATLPPRPRPRCSCTRSRSPAAGPRQRRPPPLARSTATSPSETVAGSSTRQNENPRTSGAPSRSAISTERSNGRHISAGSASQSHFRNGEAIAHTTTPREASSSATAATDSGECSTMFRPSTDRSSTVPIPSSAHTSSACARCSEISSVTTLSRTPRAAACGSRARPRCRWRRRSRRRSCRGSRRPGARSRAAARARAGVGAGPAAGAAARSASA